jgi:hypothetical protein
MRAEYVADGTATITGTLGGYSRSTNINFATTFAGGYLRITDAVAGSLRAAVSDLIDTAIAGGAPTNVLTDTQMYLFESDKSRNATCWAAAFDTSCVAVWDSHWGGSWGNMTLVSSNVAVMADHHTSPPAVGATIEWVSMAGAISTQTISAVAGVPGADIRVLLLTPGVDVADYAPAKVFASDYADFLPLRTNVTLQLPAIQLDQERRVFVADVRTVAGASYGLPEDSDRAAFYSLPVVGDSSSPVLVYPAAGVPVLVATHSGTDNGPSYMTHRAALISTIATLGGDTNVATVALGAYTDWSE